MTFADRAVVFACSACDIPNYNNVTARKTIYTHKRRAYYRIMLIISGRVPKVLINDNNCRRGCGNSCLPSAGNGKQTNEHTKRRQQRPSRLKYNISSPIKKSTGDLN